MELQGKERDKAKSYLLFVADVMYLHVKAHL